MASYQRGVGARYETFLSEFSHDAPDELHALVVTAMITGSLGQLSQWLNRRYGPAAFLRIFKTSSYTRSSTISTTTSAV
jgi:hypothetical protein